ncbi:hypothetical protein GGD54_002056 [Rhizobium tropici]|uniref:Uncharacterized protein n=1 Tax=Rhizobium tropici TaxID=398 RepID=A0ABR6QYS2_RHITR|nr:hypothetical protein [Rhizobium tropici]MBB5592929.1 hypothetical protein [Rhizobium tropici]MBB6491971.1 hypothetical protein [Rhizobium tropici]
MGNYDRLDAGQAPHPGFEAARLILTRTGRATSTARTCLLGRGPQLRRRAIVLGYPDGNNILKQ